MTNPDDKLAEYLGGEVTRFHRKKKLREELRRRISDHGDGDSHRVVGEIETYLRERPAVRTVALFAALPGEVDLRCLCADTGRVWAFPKIASDELVLCRVRSYEEDLAPGAYGIREPREGLEEVGIAEVDLFLCPGLGFDLQGGRIGRGRGFYDRILRRARPDAVKLGICFGFQIVDEVEMEEHDVRMNGVIAG